MVSKPIKTPRPALALDEFSPLDPTINVQNLLLAALQRVDDLANAEHLRVDERTAADMLRIDELRAAEIRRIDDSLSAEARRVDEQMVLREHYEESLRQAEAKRIDANRAGDAAAVATANERAVQQAAALATQMTAMIENTRSLIASSTASATQQLQAATNAMNERISTLERASYEGKGKESLTDPMLSELVKKMETVITTMSTNTGKGMGASSLWGYIIGAIGVITVVITLVMKLAGV